MEEGEGISHKERVKGRVRDRGLSKKEAVIIIERVNTEEGMEQKLEKRKNEKDLWKRKKSL